MEEARVKREFNIQQERREILSRYRRLLSVYKPKPENAKEDFALIRKAFKVALEAHSNMRRKSGEPYIYHPLEVARICVEEIGLGATAIAAALLHDVVEDRSDLYSIEDIRRLFGDKIANICQGLTKIKEIFDHTQPSDQADHYRKLLLTMSSDVRVILIKLADRLHNMRTLEYMRPEKQLKIAAETTYLFAPLAHRLGLYAIKSELEDLALKFTEPEIYSEISRRLAESEHIRESFASEFLFPIRKELNERGFKYRILVRNKSVYSIWNKMKRKNIPFDEVYDVFAIRIILDVPVQQEKAACWETYSIVTSHYRPKPDRLRDWVSIPRANGYQALHTTVMSHIGKWVEVQIRSERMDEIAEKGYAAHWKYKGEYYEEKNVENWLDRVREMLQREEAGALDFIEDFQSYLFTSEIFVFTPKGEMRILPAGSTVLDFAYAIHSEVGHRCIGANVNHSLKNKYYQLQNGDQIEILTSKKSEPTEEWLQYAKTSRARSKIREYLREKKQQLAEEGRVKITELFDKLHWPVTEEKIEEVMHKLNYTSEEEFYAAIAEGQINEINLRKAYSSNSRSWLSIINPFQRHKNPTPGDSLVDQVARKLKENNQLQLLDKNIDRIKYKVADCCKPIPGDDVMGYYDALNDQIVVHRAQCREALHLMATFGHNIVKVKWERSQGMQFLAGIRIHTIDRKGLLHEISEVITNEMDSNIKSIHFETDQGVSEGMVFLYISNLEKLKELIAKIRKIEGVHQVMRIDNYISGESGF
ncbi:MAG: bifunctional (p)ppGpp synthetase/guanosine-3',5'-bis(diphosphate) 3'-pyrophosphohydrolase [Bacteroidales bacterium]|jgi:GTP pyrophosphokinase|nr:bifunctional (p)ppGpp synthetase/guanosine-3',5'-bis(diphosphate) 3'-pyrophosphohydrolase [Bacteroidales bacterium]